MRYISVFSGIEAASVAWEPLGWDPVAFCEIDEFPSAVLAEHFPHVPNLGDITKVDWSAYAGTVDIVVGGSPCQSFSVAGKREGLAGASGLMFEYIRAVRELRPRFFVWENVPGALSSEDGAAFGQLLSEMDDLRYGVAWRVLDAEFFGVAQRRRRVFLVGCLGDPERAAEILFEPDGLRWDNPTSREKRAELAGASGAGAGCDCEDGCLTPWDVQSRRIFDAGSAWPALYAGDGGGHGYAAYAVRMREGKPGGGKGPLVQTDVSGTLATGNDQTIFQPIAFKWHQGSGAGILGCQEGVSPTIDTVKPPAICFTQNTRDEVRLLGGDGSIVGALAASPGAKQQNYVCYEDDETPMVLYDGLLWTVRRLMPVECERLQGFQDGWTDIPWHGKDHAPDGPRYKAIGNSMCVQVMRWIGKKMQEVDDA